MKRQRCEPDGPFAAKGQEKHLYLIFDDYPWGYSIREMNLPDPSYRRKIRPSSHQKAASASGNKGAARRLPRPIICFEAPRGYPMYISAVGTRIVATHPRDPFGDDSGDGFLPIIDVRWRGVTFGPGRICQDIPIYLPVGDALFSLDTCNFRKLSFEQLWPPRLENRHSSDVGWSWCDLPRPPFDRMYVTSYAVHGQSIMISIERDADPTFDPDSKTVLFSNKTFPATFTFDTVALVWERRGGEWVMPFTGRAFFVHGLTAFVGLSKDTATFGHLCSCEVGDATNPPPWKLGKEKLFSDDPHVGATLMYMGSSAFCLLQCVSIEHSNNADQKHQKVELEEGEQAPANQKHQKVPANQKHQNGELEEGGQVPADQKHQNGELEEGGVAPADQKHQNGELEEGGVPPADNQKGKLQEGGEAPRRRSYLYRLTTFSLSFDDNGDLTTGGTCQVQCYNVPEETTKRFLGNDPVAFWL